MQELQIKIFLSGIDVAGRAVSRQRGAAMPEYGLLVALIAVFLVAAITVLRDGIVALYTAAGAAMTASRTGSAAGGSGCSGSGDRSS